MYIYIYIHIYTYIFMPGVLQADRAEQLGVDRHDLGHGR